MQPEDLARRRYKEAMQAKQALGLADYEVLSYHDGHLKDSEPVRAEVARQIRDWNADVVFTFYPAEGGHNDNMNAGWAQSGHLQWEEEKTRQMNLQVNRRRFLTGSGLALASAASGLFARNEVTKDPSSATASREITGMRVGSDVDKLAIKHKGPAAVLDYLHGQEFEGPFFRLMLDLSPTLDTGNLPLEADVPMDAIRRLAPYVHLTHCKDGILLRTDQGIVQQIRTVGEGVVDWDAALDVLGKYQPNLQTCMFVLRITGPRTCCGFTTRNGGLIFRSSPRRM